MSIKVKMTFAFSAEGKVVAKDGKTLKDYPHALKGKRGELYYKEGQHIESPTPKEKKLLEGLPGGTKAKAKTKGGDK
jgi:hypothetical protein